jgi:hypothetical protein
MATTTKRLTLSSLLEDTNYVVRVRANNAQGEGAYSAALNFKTISDGVLPSTPTNPTWVTVGDSFHGEWDAVTTNVDGDTIAVTRYEVQLTSQGISFIQSVTPVTGDRVSFDLSHDANVALFGRAEPSISFEVRTVDNKELKSDYTAAIIATQAKPQTPTGFSADAATDSLTFSWNANTDDTSGYNLYTGTTANFTPTIGGMIWSGDGTSFTYGDTTYSPQYFALEATDEFGQSSDPVYVGPVQPISPFVIDTTAPPVPTGLTATITNNTNGIGSSAAVSWSETAPDDLAGFYIRWRPVGGTNYSVSTFAQDDRTGTIVLPSAYTNYEFQIKAFDWAYNESAWSATVTATSPANAVPSNVSGLTATTGMDSIGYSWTAVSDQDIKNYEVAFSTSSTFASGNVTYLTGTATSLVVPGLTPSTTYYARVRANDTGGLSSAAWSSTVSATTDSTPNKSDGIPPSSSPTPAVTGGIGYLFASWSPITNADPVTYEVHTSTTSGFTPSAATKAAETAATVISLEKNPNGTLMAYGTTYYVAIIAKDADGSAAPSSQASGTIAQVGSGDLGNGVVTAANMAANSITAANGAIAALAVVTANLADAAITTAKIADASITDAKITTLNVSKLTAGTIGSGVGITMASGSSILLNGGNIHSNTYTGTTAASNPSGAGFYLGNDGLRIDQGQVSASALTTGTISGTNTITLSGANAKIVAGSWSLSGSGLSIPNGGIGAAALAINTDNTNVLPYTVSRPYLMAGSQFLMGWDSGVTPSVATGATPVGQSSQKVTFTTSGQKFVYFGPNGGSNFDVIPSQVYVLSGYVTANAAATYSLGINWADSSNTYLSSSYVTVSATTSFARYSGTVTAPSNAVQAVVVFGSSTSGVANAWAEIDGIQLELQTNSSVVTPSSWTPGIRTTTISGDMIKTGSIISNAIGTVWNGSAFVADPNNQPAWSINTNGAASFGDLQVTGSIRVGQNASVSSSHMPNISSYNYVAGSVGWSTKADGSAEFNNITARGTIVTGNSYPYIELSTAFQDRIRFYVADTSTYQPGELTVNSSNRILSLSSPSTTPTSIDFSYLELWPTEFVLSTQDNPDQGNTGNRTSIIGSSAIISMYVNGTYVFQASNSAITIFTPTQVYGSFTSDSLAVNNNATVGGTLVVSGAFQANSGTITYGLTVNSFTVNTTTTMSGALQANGGINMGASSLTGVNNINALGTITFQGVPGNTSSNAANVFVGTGGQLYKSTSSERYKMNIRDYDRTPEQILSVRPVWFNSKNADDGGKDFAGFIAEEMHAAGLSEWVNYDEQGRPDAIPYPHFVAAHQLVLREHQREIAELKAELKKLKERS